MRNFQPAVPSNLGKVLCALRLEVILESSYYKSSSLSVTVFFVGADSTR